MKKRIIKKNKSYWLEIIMLILIFLLIIYLKSRFDGDMISPYDGFMAVWRG